MKKNIGCTRCFGAFSRGGYPMRWAPMLSNSSTGNAPTISRAFRSGIWRFTTIRKPRRQALVDLLAEHGAELVRLSGGSR